MRRILLVTIFLFNGPYLYSQPDTLKELIISSLKIYESNPTQKEKSEYLNGIFDGLICDTVDTNLMEMFDLLYDISFSNFEDKDDMRRTKMRQSLCYSTIALLADKDKFEYFIDLAKYSVVDSTGNPIEFLERNYCGLLLLDIYIKTKHNLDYQKDKVDLNNKLEKYKIALPIDFYKNTKLILKRYK